MDTPKAKPEKMTPKQARFVIEYLIDLNATQAAIRSGYSENSAAEIGSDNLRKPHISKAIAEQEEARATRTLITADKVLHEIYQIANCDLNEAFDDNGDLKPLKDIPVYVRKAIAGIEIDSIYELEKDPSNPLKLRKVEIGVTKKIRFWDKNRSLENLARNLKLLTDKMELGNADGSNFDFPQMQRVYVKSPDEVPKNHVTPDP